MKKQSLNIALALTGTLALGIMGCSQQSNTAQTQAPAQEQTTQEQAPAKTEQTTQTQTETPAPATNNTGATTQSAGIISEEEAKSIALTDAGVAEADTKGLYVKYDIDDGVEKYDVNFYVGMTEYDYDINATTGAIMERSAEVDD